MGKERLHKEVGRRDTIRVILLNLPFGQVPSIEQAQMKTKWCEIRIVNPRTHIYTFLLKTLPLKKLSFMFLTMLGLKVWRLRFYIWTVRAINNIAYPINNQFS